MRSIREYIAFILLVLTVITTMLIGIFVDWESWYYIPALVIAVGMFSIWLIAITLDISNKAQNKLFIWVSFLNFIVYSITSFIAYTGGIEGITIVFPFLLIICITYTYLYNHYNGKLFTTISHIIFVVIFTFSILLVIGGTSLAGMGV